MNTKLTLTLEEGVIKDAKKYARATGTSLSRLVQFYFFSLASASSRPKSSLPPITSSLSGLAKRGSIVDDKAALAEALAQKYL